MTLGVLGRLPCLQCAVVKRECGALLKRKVIATERWTESSMAEVTEALQAMVLEGQEMPHPKVPNPHGFPLPRPGQLICRGVIHKEVRRDL